MMVRVVSTMLVAIAISVTVMVGWGAASVGAGHIDGISGCRGVRGVQGVNVPSVEC
jgi:hypothetical protein